MLIGPLRDAAAPWRPGQKAQLHEVGFVNILQRDGFLPDGGGQGLQAHRATPVVIHNGREHPPVHGVQAQMVDLQGAEGLVGHLRRDDAVCLHLSVVPHPPEHAVCDTGRAPAPPCDLISPVRLDVHPQDARRAGDDPGQLLRGVELQPQRHAEAVPQRRGELPRPGGGADEGEMGQVQADGIGTGALPHDDVQGVILHGRVQDLLHRAVQAVDLIHEEDVPLIEVGQKRRQVAGLLDGGTGGDADAGPHLLGNDPGEGRFAEARGAMEQNMIQGLVPSLGRLDEDGELFPCPLLADILRKGLGPEGGFLGVLRQESLGHDGILVDVIPEINAHGLPSSVAKDVVDHIDPAQKAVDDGPSHGMPGGKRDHHGKAAAEGDAAFCSFLGVFLHRYPFTVRPAQTGRSPGRHSRPRYLP